MLQASLGRNLLHCSIFKSSTWVISRTHVLTIFHDCIHRERIRSRTMLTELWSTVNHQSASGMLRLSSVTSNTPQCFFLLFSSLLSAKRRRVFLCSRKKEQVKPRHEFNVATLTWRLTFQKPHCRPLFWPGLQVMAPAGHARTLLPG